MHDFTPISALVGGGLLGLGALVLYLATGRFAGISSIFGGGLFYAPKGENAWRLFFLGGLVLGGVVMGLCTPAAFAAAAPRALPFLGVAGLLVGFGTRLGGGCTSGHGICGNAHLSVRSIVATLTFIATGALAVWGAELLGGLA